MFNYHDFVYKAICGMVGNEADYKVRLRAMAQQEAGVLTVDDLAAIETKIEAQYPVTDETEA